MLICHFCLTQGDPILELLSHPEALQIVWSRRFGEFASLRFDASGQPQVGFVWSALCNLVGSLPRAPPHPVSTGTPHAAAQGHPGAPSAVRSRHLWFCPGRFVYPAGCRQDVSPQETGLFQASSALGAPRSFSSEDSRGFAC